MCEILPQSYRGRQWYAHLALIMAYVKNEGSSYNSCEKGDWKELKYGKILPQSYIECQLYAEPCLNNGTVTTKAALYIRLERLSVSKMNYWGFYRRVIQEEGQAVREEK